MTGFKVGTVTHYYTEIGVAIVDLIGALHTGDRIKVIGQREFIQKVDSLQVEHEQVTMAAAGDTVGLRVREPVEVGDEICQSS